MRVREGFGSSCLPASAPSPMKMLLQTRRSAHCTAEEEGKPSNEGTNRGSLRHGAALHRDAENSTCVKMSIEHLEAILEPMCARGFLRQVTRLCVANKEIGVAAPMGTASQIYDASKDGDAGSLTTYLAYWKGNREGKVVFNWFSSDGLTCLQAAVKCNKLACVELLVAEPAVDINIKRPFSRDAGDDDADLTPLHIASRENFIEIVRVLATAPGIRLNFQWYREDTPLHLAATRGHTEVVRFLLGLKDVRLQEGNKAGKTPLDLALDAGHSGVATLLREAIEKKRSLDAAGVELVRAAHQGNMPELQRLCKKWSGNVLVLNWSLSDRENDTVIDDVLRGAMDVSAVLIAVHQGHLEAVRLLLETPGVDPHIVHKHTGFNILMIAAARGHLAVVGLLLSAVPDLDVNFVARLGQTAIVLAIMNRHIEIFKFLLPLVNVNLADDRGMTVLMLVSERASVELVHLLLERPAIDVNFVGGLSPYDETALDYARHNPTVQGVLRERGAKTVDELMSIKGVVRIPRTSYARRKTWIWDC